MALRSKMYAYRTLAEQEVQKAGGIPRRATESELRMEHYLCYLAGAIGAGAES